MIKVEKVKMGKMDVTITSHLPDDMTHIYKAIEDFHLQLLRERFSDEEIEFYAPHYNCILQIQNKNGISYKEGVKIYIDKIKKEVLKIQNEKGLSFQEGFKLYLRDKKFQTT